MKSFWKKIRINNKKKLQPAQFATEFTQFTA